MATRGTIQLKLANAASPVVPLRGFGGQIRDWTDFTSEKIELAGLEWHVTGKTLSQGHQISSILIHCAPVGGKKTVIWNCEAYGVIMMTAKSTIKPVTWSQSFNFRCLSSLPMNYPGVCSHEEETKLNSTVVHIKVISYVLIDLSLPDNKMIHDSDDAAQVSVDGEKLWLSKLVLGFYSPFFKVLFNSDFKEKLTGIYELNDIVLAEFLHFISLVYGLQVRIDGDSVEYLLKMADYFQCDMIIQRCRDFLLQVDQLPADTKLQLADRYGLFDVVFKTVQTMNTSELKNCAALCGFSLPTTEILFKRLDEFVELPTPRSSLGL